MFIGAFVGGATLLSCGARSELDTVITEAVDAAADAQTEVAPTGCRYSTQTALAPADGAPDEIIVNDGYVYWNTTGAIYRVPTTGGTPVQLVMTPEDVTVGYAHFVLDGPNIAWVKHGTLGSTPLAGGPTQTALVDPSYAGVVASGAGLWIWQTTQGPPANLAQVEDGAVNVLTSQLPWGTAQMIVDSSASPGLTFYGGVGGPGFGVFQLLGGGTELGWLLVGTPITDLAWDGMSFFYTQFGDGNQDAAVWRLETPSATMLSHEGAVVLGGIALSADDVYFTNRTAGTVERVGKTGQDHVTVGSVPNTQPMGVAVDGACVYWTNLDDVAAGTIYVAPMPLP